MGLLFKHQRKKHCQLTDTERGEVIRLYRESAMKVSEIAERFNISIGTVFNIVKRADIPHRREKEWRKVMKMGYSRAITIPSRVIQRLGIGDGDPVEGKWEIRDGNLVLILKRPPVV